MGRAAGKSGLSPLRSSSQEQWSSTLEVDSASAKMFADIGVKLVSNQEGKARAERLLKSSIQRSLDSIDKGQLKNSDESEDLVESFDCSKAIRDLKNTFENKFGEGGSGKFRTGFEVGNKIIKIPRTSEFYSAFLGEILTTPADAFCSQYVEKHAADTFQSDNGIKVAPTELFHTDTGIPILVMEKVKLFNERYNSRVWRSLQQEFFGDGPNQISLHELHDNFERLAQIGIRENGEAAIFDAGDWWQLTDRAPGWSGEGSADFTKEYRVDLYQACPPSIANYQYKVQELARSIKMKKESEVASFS